MTNYLIVFLLGLGLSWLVPKAKGKAAQKKKTSFLDRLRPPAPKGLDEMERELGIVKPGKPDLELEAFRVERINNRQKELLEE